jgi:hypothetical protein
MKYANARWIENQPRLKANPRSRIMSRLAENLDLNPYVTVMGTAENVRKVLDELIGKDSKILVRIRVETI